LEITYFAKYNYQVIYVGAPSKYQVDFLLNENYKFPGGDA